MHAIVQHDTWLLRRLAALALVAIACYTGVTCRVLPLMLIVLLPASPRRSADHTVTHPPVSPCPGALQHLAGGGTRGRSKRKHAAHSHCCNRGVWKLPTLADGLVYGQGAGPSRGCGDAGVGRRVVRHPRQRNRGLPQPVRAAGPLCRAVPLVGVGWRWGSQGMPVCGPTQQHAHVLKLCGHARHWKRAFL